MLELGELESMTRKQADELAQWLRRAIGDA